MKRQVSLSRRLRANLGTIINTGLWATAALACLVLYAAAPVSGRPRAVAVVERHPVVVPSSGRLATLEVGAGDTVQAGQVLGSVEVPGLSSRLAGAEAELEALRATLAAGDPSEARRFAKDTAGAQSRWLSSRVELEALRAEAVGLDLELARLQAPGIGVAAAELEQRQAARSAIAARIAAVGEEVAALEAAYVTARSLQAEGSDALLEARVQAAAAEVEELLAEKEASILRAPSAGTVAAVPDRAGVSPIDTGSLPAPGQWLQAGTPAMSVVEPAAREAVAWLSPAQARALASGAPVELRGDDGEIIAAHVVAVGAAVEPVPVRQLADPTVLEWGVPVTMRTDSTLLMPGEGFGILGLP